jgi:isocitrate lyase
MTVGGTVPKNKFVVLEPFHTGKYLKQLRRVLGVRGAKLSVFAARATCWNIFYAQKWISSEIREMAQMTVSDGGRGYESKVPYKIRRIHRALRMADKEKQHFARQKVLREVSRMSTEEYKKTLFGSREFRDRLRSAGIEIVGFPEDKRANS